MTTLEQFVSPALTRALGWTLLHSLWQGALVAAVLAGALLLLRRQRAEVRYAASAGALGVVVALAGITFGIYINASPGGGALAAPTSALSQQAGTRLPAEALVADASVAASAMVVPAAITDADAASARPAPAAAAALAAPAAPQTLIRSITQSVIHGLNSNLSLLVLAWLVGLLAMGLRMLGGLLYVQRLRRYRVRPLNADWQQRLAALAARSGVKRPVALLESALVRVPLVVGHLRPVILLPLGTVAGLSGAQLEAILAHELAHVLRRDYLVNLLQTLAEVLFFYHPAVWFVGNCVRAERENCCDDTATALVGGDPMRLARALTALAEWSQSAVVPTAPRLALAAIGKRGELLSRVRRLVTRRPAAPTLAEGIMAGALVLGGLVLLGSSVALAGPLAEATTAKAARVVRKAAASPATPAVPQPLSAIETAEAIEENYPEPDGVRDLVLLPGGRARASINGITAEFDTLLNPVIMQRSRRQGAPGTVVITRDKKGRLTSLLVNGQPVPVPTGQLTKEERRAGQQVTVLPAPPAGPDSRSRVVVYSTDQTQAGPNPKTDREVARARRELEKASRKLDKMGHQMDQAAEKLDRKTGGTYVYTESRRTPNSDLNINIDDNALNQLVTNALKLGNVGLNIGLQAANQGLEEARRSLEETLRDPSLSAEARRATRDALAELRQEQGSQRQGQEARDRQQEMLDRQQEARDRAQEVRDRKQEMLDRQQEARDRAQEARDRAQERRDQQQQRADQDRERNEALVADMLKDGLMRDPNHYQIKLTASRLVIDGKEQPQKVFQKYLKRYESTTGRKLTGNNAMVITRSSDSSTIISGDGLTPPRPPRAPRAPRAPQAPLPPVGAVAPPAPPRPPRLDSAELREELRKDGVIGADEHDLQFQLSNAGLTVNGKKQPEELAAKYRRLTGHDDGKKFNVMISTQE